MIRFLFAAVLMATSQFAVAATESEYVEGRHYQVVPMPSAPTDPKKIRVEEFFWYGCPHCYRLDPTIIAWAKKQPADVDFIRVPNNLGHEAGMVHERAFYIAQLLGIEDQIHRPFMDALVRDRMPLVTLASVRDFFVQTAHIKPEDFDGAANSFIVEANMRRADQEAMDYRITSVPTLVIGGKYLTDISQPGIMDARLGETELYGRMMKVVDFLVDKVRSERKLK